MAQRLQRFDFTSSSGGSRFAPQGSLVTFAPGVVTALEVQIPRGHAGLTGISFYYGDAPIWPKNPEVYLKGSHRLLRKELDDPQPGGEGWLVYHWNEDPMYDHTWHVTVELDELTGRALLPGVLLLRQTGEAGAGELVPAGGPVYGPPLPGPGPPE